MLQLLHNDLKKSLPIHTVRLKRLITSTGCLLSHAPLSMTAIGRKTKGPAKVKNKIKAVDRLLGNNNLYAEQVDIYKIMAKKIIGNMQNIDILVDWSSVGNNKNHMLRASIAFDGRSVTLYQEVHPEKLLGNYNIHKQFLNNLKRIIPSGCNVNIITDAGFRTEWFELVQKQDWDFTGRVLTPIAYKLDGEDNWQLCSTLYEKATNIPTYISRGTLAKERQLECDIYLYSEKLNKQILNKVLEPKKKKRKIRTSGCGGRKYRKSYETPWLLVTSKKHHSNNAKKIVMKYSRRMKIEHDFRSTKNFKTGLGLNIYGKHDIKQKPHRLAILLLLAALAMYVLWLIGLAAEAKKLHYRFQANTYKDKRVLSLIFLGLQVIEHCIEEITIHDMLSSLLKTQEIEQQNGENQ